MATTKTKTTKTTKAPQDHNPKNGPREVTVHGITLIIDPAAFDDFIVLDLMARVQEDQDALAVPALFRRIVGTGNFHTIMAHLADEETGRVDVEEAVTFMSDLMAEVSPNS